MFKLKIIHFIRTNKKAFQIFFCWWVYPTFLFSPCFGSKNSSIFSRVMESFYRKSKVFLIVLGVRITTLWLRWKTFFKIYCFKLASGFYNLQIMLWYLSQSMWVRQYQFQIWSQSRSSHTVYSTDKYVVDAHRLDAKCSLLLVWHSVL